MRFIDYIRTAFGNIWRQKLRSALTIFAVVIGATSVTIMLCLVTAAKSFFIKQVEANGMLQQVAISPKQDITDFQDASHGGGNCDSCTKLTDSMVTKIQQVPHVTAVTRILQGYNIQGIEYNNKKLSTYGLKAYDINGVITSNILAGRELTAADKEGVVVLTSDYADKFGFKGNYPGLIGKQVNLITQKGYSGVGANIPQPVPGQNMSPGDMPPTILTATIVGISDTSSDSQTIRAPIEWVRQMNVQRMWQFTEADRKAQEAACQKVRGPCNPPQKMTLVTQDFVDQQGYPSLIARTDTSSNAKQAAEDIKKLGVGASDAESMIKSQLTVFNIIGFVLGGIGGIALIVAAIGVINTMIMAILERTREIGVMRALGARRSTVRRLFTFEASLLGFSGGVIGVAVGFGLTRVANVFVNKQLADQGVHASNIVTLPIWLMLIVIGIATLIGLLAGLYPAHRAARLNPVDALHYE